MLHAEGKKHRGKARAIHAAKQQPKQPEESAPVTKPQPEETPKGTEEPKLQDASRVDTEHKSSEAENGNLLSKKKRKPEESKNGESRKKTKDTTSGEVGNENVIQNGKSEANGKDTKLKKDKVVESDYDKEEPETKIKWKKLITSTLKSVSILNNINPTICCNSLCTHLRNLGKKNSIILLFLYSTICDMNLLA